MWLIVDEDSGKTIKTAQTYDEAKFLVEKFKEEDRTHGYYSAVYRIVPNTSYGGKR